MKLTFLGTSAANAFPEPFCKCKNCKQARDLGGPSLRQRSAALINDDLLIDLGPDVLSSANLHKRPLTNVRYCLQTHAHADHFDSSHLLSRSPGYGVIGAPTLDFFASPASLRLAARLLERDCAPYSLLDPEIGQKLNLRIQPVEPLKPFMAGRYKVIAFPANHDQSVESLLYAIQTDKGCIFYGTDTAALTDNTWQAFHQFKLHLDLVIFDHTYGPDYPASDHLNAWEMIEHAKRMRIEGLMTENARIFATHISHDANPSHPELVQFAKQHGYEVAYDGLSIDLSK
jgi:phosphoribosyl 1,2-cyclic phosphate phosphodiesterase